jgi:hypothetical protein
MDIDPSLHKTSGHKKQLVHTRPLGRVGFRWLLYILNDLSASHIAMFDAALHVALHQ